MDILAGMVIKPRTIIVKTHGSLGAPTEEVRELLDRMEYNIVNSVL